MVRAKTVIWIVVGVCGAGLIVLIVIAGAGIYFVTHHIRAQPTSDADAIHAFDTVRATFHGVAPLYELDSAEEAHATRPLAELPTATGSERVSSVCLLAWNPDDRRLVRITLPLWTLNFGRQHMAVSSAAGGFDLRHMNLDVDELERIGPALILDFRAHDGARVLMWTE